jgi:hypothetical protein
VQDVKFRSFHGLCVYAVLNSKYPGIVVELDPKNRNLAYDIDYDMTGDDIPELIS